MTHTIEVRRAAVVVGAIMLATGSQGVEPSLAGERAVAAAHAGGFGKSVHGGLQGPDSPAFSFAPSSPGVARYAVRWYIAAPRRCTRAYKVPESCVETGPERRAETIRYAPADPQRVLYAFGVGGYVKAFTANATHGWYYAGDAMPGVAGEPLSVLVFPAPGERVMLTVRTQPKCGGCQ